MQHVLYIAASPFSGSTLLDLLLGTNPGYIGLGEIYSLCDREYQVLNQDSTTPCSCKCPANECSFWGAIWAELQSIHNDPDGTHEASYRVILHRFAEDFGNETVLVDGSKHWKGLAVWMSIPEVEVRVVHMAKDVRSWVVSHRRHFTKTKANRSRWPRPWHRWVTKVGYRALRHSAFGAFMLWYRHNRKLTKFISEQGIPCYRLGYEELCHAPAEHLRKLIEFSDGAVQGGLGDLSPAASLSHNILGNIMRIEPERLKEIRYDMRWLIQRDWLLPALMMPWVLRLNEQLVYGNLAKQ